MMILELVTVLESVSVLITHQETHTGNPLSLAAVAAALASSAVLIVSHTIRSQYLEITDTIFL